MTDHHRNLENLECKKSKRVWLINKLMIMRQNKIVDLNSQTWQHVLVVQTWSSGFFSSSRATCSSAFARSFLWKHLMAASKPSMSFPELAFRSMLLWLFNWCLTLEKLRGWKLESHLDKSIRLCSNSRFSTSCLLSPLTGERNKTSQTNKKNWNVEQYRLESHPS